MGKLDSINNKVVGSMKAAAAATAAIAIPALLVGRNILKTGMDYEQAITNVGAVGLKTRAEIFELDKKAKELGAATKFTATEAANAMEIMSRAGFTAQDVLAGVGGVLSAAAASGMEMAEVADHVGNIMKGMGLNAADSFGPWATQTERVADVLTMVSSRTNSTIGTLGESMKNLSPVARQMGVSLEEAVAAVGLLQDVGLDASEAGTSTATMLTKLSKPAAGVAKRMKEMGIAFQDSNGDALKFTQILDNFSKAAQEGGGNMEVVAFFADLVGLRGQKAALNLQAMFKSGKTADLAKEIENAHGAAKKMADLRMNTLEGDLEVLGSAIDDVKISMFELDGIGLRPIVQSMTAWITANKGLILSETQKWLNEAKELFIAIKDNLPEIWKWTKRVGKALMAWAAFTLVAKTVTAAIGGIGLAIKGVNLALAVMTAFKAGGMVAAIGAITNALWGVKTAATAATAAQASMGLTAAGAAIGAAGAVAVGSGVAAYLMNKDTKSKTEGLGTLDLLWRSMTHRDSNGMAKSMKKVMDEHQNSLAVGRRAHADAQGSIAASAEQSALSVAPFMPMTPQPTTTAPAEVTKKTIEQRTQRSELVLRVEGAAKVIGRPVPGVTLVPQTGGF